MLHRFKHSPIVERFLLPRDPGCRLTCNSTSIAVMPGMDFLQAAASPAVARPSKRSRPAAGRGQKPLEQQVQDLTQLSAGSQSRPQSSRDRGLVNSDLAVGSEEQFGKAPHAVDGRMEGEDAARIAAP